MLTTTSSMRSPTDLRGHLGFIRAQIAEAMVGQTVDLLADASTIIHGVVAGVLSEAGLTKIVVNRKQYNLNQILTATPKVLN